MAEGIAALTSLKSLYDLAQEMRASFDPERLRVYAGQMLDLALSARAQTAALQEERNAAVEELAALKRKVEEMNRFDDQEKNYTRERDRTGATVYREKGSSGAQGDSPYFCPHCFLNKKLSIMNPLPTASNLWYKPYSCPICKTPTELSALRR